MVAAAVAAVLDDAGAAGDAGGGSWARSSSTSRDPWACQLRVPSAHPEGLPRRARPLFAFADVAAICS